jgi:hypothetical protein
MHPSLWPLWLPFPISWARAGANVAVFSAVAKGVIQSALEVDEPEDIIPIVLAGLLLHFAIIVLGHHCITKLINKKSAWFPGWLSWREGINGSIVLVVELLSTSLFVVFLAVTIDSTESEAGRIFVLRVLAFFFIVAAYLYHYDFLVRQRRAARLARKYSTAMSAPVPVDPVDVELNQLRGQMGLTQMRRRPKK